VGGAPSLAVGMAAIFSGVFGQHLMGLWYHFAIMFEALFILTTIDTGTRVGRFMLQELLGHLWRPLGRTSWYPSSLFAAFLIVAGWGWFLIQGVTDPLGGINSLWPLFGITNQLLAAVALCVGTTLIIKSGKGRYAWTTLVPLVALLLVTLTAGWQKIFAADPRLGFLSHARDIAARIAAGGQDAAVGARLIFNDRMNAVLAAFFMATVVALVIASALAYFLNEGVAKAKYGTADKMNYEAPLTSLVWVTSAISIALTYLASYLIIPHLAGDASLWWKLATIISCGTLAGAVIPELVKVFTSVESAHVKEVVTSSREGGASLNILSGFVAGNFSAYWLGISIVMLMGVSYYFSSMGLAAVMAAPAVFAFGLVAFGFLGMGPVTIAVDSYGPVTDNAQSVFELSVIEQIPGVKEQIRRDYNFDAKFDVAKDLLEENDGAGNTFKATAKPVLIGTAVVGATTMIFSIIVVLTSGLTQNLDKLSLLHPPFLLGLITGGAVIYWFTGAATQAVSTGAYRAVEFIKANIRLEGATKASVEDSKKVVEICTQYAQKGMFNIFLTVFFSTLAFAFFEPYFFIGYLISIALFGLYQAVFMANAGGAWDNAKKIVETELKEKGSPLHAATVVGDTVGDPFKDTSSVAMNPVIKFTTLFGLLAVELAVSLSAASGPGLSRTLSVVFFLLSTVFVWRSFYGMRIRGGEAALPHRAVGAVARGK